MPKFLSLFDSQIETYLNQCRVINGLVEKSGVHVPPTADETRDLMAYLRSKGLKPAIVGSVGILKHLGPNIDPRIDFRPTVDLDVWVTKVPPPPPGWRQDREAIGVASWISPSGGFVDFMQAGDELDAGVTVPHAIEYDKESATSDMPVAHQLTILKMKLNSYREKDLSDSIALIRAMGKMPSAAQLGKLTQTQRDNFDLISQWFQLRPHGKYGE